MPHRPIISTRSALLALSMTLPVLLLGAFSLAQDNKTEKQVPAGKKYKNIKVLKDLPADQLIPVMHKIDDSLGVKCDFCHVINPDHTGFEKDDKPTKEKCRQMMLMTQDLNKRYKTVDKKVSCFTCHQGHPEPMNTPEPKPSE